MNLHHLYYFQAVAQLQSFTKASETLYISQPTLSYAIGSLEKELGVSLIARGTRSAILTEDGKAFLDYVNKSLESLEQGIQFLHNRVDPSMYAIRVLSDRVMNVLSEIKVFRATGTCDDIDFSLSKCLSSNVEQQLFTGDYDIGFQAKQPATSGLEYIQIPDAEIVLLVPLNHPLASSDSIDLRDVDWDQNVVIRQTRAPDPRAYQIASLYKQIGYDTSRASSRAHTTLGVACLVEAGFGIGIVPKLEHLKSFDVKAIPICYPKDESTYFMLRKRDAHSLSAASRFFTHVATRYGQPDIVKL